MRDYRERWRNKELRLYDETLLYPMYDRYPEDFQDFLPAVCNARAFCKCLENHGQSVQPTPTSTELPPTYYIPHAKCLSPWTIWLNVKHAFSGSTIAVKG